MAAISMSQPLQHSESAVHPAQDIGTDDTSGVSQEQKLEYLVDVFHDFLLDTVDISALQSVIQILDTKQVVEIQELERRNQMEEATAKLIEYIKKSKEPGKWRAFFDGLESIGNSIVVETVLKENYYSKWHDTRKILIKLFAGKIEETLKLDCILPYCVGLLPDGSFEKVQSLLNDGSTRSAIRVFFLNISRKKPTWYEEFMETLYKHGHENLARTIDQDFCEELKNKREASKSEETAPREHAIEERGRDTASLTQHGQENLMETQDAAHGQRESSHACPCCTSIMQEVASLRKEILEMKDVLKDLKRDTNF